MLNSPMYWNGIRVTIVPPNTHSSEVKRKWKERLFSLPFQPFKVMKLVHTTSELLKEGQILQHEGGLFMNAATWKCCQD